MNKIKRILKLIKFYLGYAFYVAITINDRNNYMEGEARGYNCTGSHDDSYVIYGSTRKYYFDPTKPPTRNYITFKQYKKFYYPK